MRGVTVDRQRIDPADRWAYDNDISLSAIGPRARDAGIVAGQWWPVDYRGTPLVALSTDAAHGEAVRVGDAIRLSMLGRDIDARVAVLRKVDLGGFGASFPIVIDPGRWPGADLSQCRDRQGEPGRGAAGDLGSRPILSPGQCDQRARTARGRGRPVRPSGAGGSRRCGGRRPWPGLLVLAGAIAAGARARAREAATLKVLGASSGQILLLYGVEYGVVGVIAGTAGVGLGYLAAWPVVVAVFETPWSMDWAGVAALVGAAAALAGIGGLVAAVRALAQRPAPLLRSE